jgi:hypothetical protein
MQIVEHSIVGTRSAVLRLKRPNTELQFLVFPMIHVASPQFFAAVEKRLRRCDLLVIEGVGRSPLTWAITLTYRVVPANKRSGLVLDNIPYRSLGVPVVNADMTSTELAKGWRALPLVPRMMLWCLIPFVAVAQFFGASRALLAPEIEVNDLPTPHDEKLADNEFVERFDQVLVGDRDDRVLATLSDLIRSRSTERIDVAIVYGAGHVPGIVRGLRERHGYRPRTADWLTVLSA